ncbi:MAG: hypothetical protein QF554_10180 [Dehalococcoidia bacterium]|jgi:hypothetical protein|nr:hypothetical protein [Dehalococcoidia bacterium]
MPATGLNHAIKEWQEARLGVSLETALSESAPVVARPSSPDGDDAGLTAVRLDGHSLIVAREDWAEAIGRVTAGMHPDLLFTPFGAYELSRVTLPDGISVWGQTGTCSLIQRRGGGDPMTASWR